MNEVSAYLRLWLLPRSWGWALLITFLKTISRMPFSSRIWCGKWIGRLIRLALRERARIVQANVAACFPDLVAVRQAQLVSNHFTSLGTGFLEMGLAWRQHMGALPIAPCVTEGLGHLAKAKASGNGILIVTAHFAPPDLMGVYLGRCVDYHAMVRPQKSQVLNDYVAQKRSYAKSVFYQHEQLKACRLLKKGECMAYFADQDYGIKHSVFAPFFNNPAATVVAVEKMARISGSVVLPAFFFRDASIKGYRLAFMPMIEPFPKENPVASAAAINSVIEQAVKRFPEQYLWGHRRFKSRPPSFKPLY